MKLQDIPGILLPPDPLRRLPLGIEKLERQEGNPIRILVKP